MTNIKMEAFPAERDEVGVLRVVVLLLLERVSEAQRLSTMVMKESDGGKRGKRRAGDDADDGDGQAGSYKSG
ncbi:uncharacterized protein HaLaN_30133, partial [Haematococcus lacustris]